MRAYVLKQSCDGDNRHSATTEACCFGWRKRGRQGCLWQKDDRNCVDLVVWVWRCCFEGPEGIGGEEAGNGGWQEANSLFFLSLDTGNLASWCWTCTHCCFSYNSASKLPPCCCGSRCVLVRGGGWKSDRLRRGLENSIASYKSWRLWLIHMIHDSTTAFSTNGTQQRQGSMHPFYTFVEPYAMSCIGGAFHSWCLWGLAQPQPWKQWVEHQADGFVLDRRWSTQRRIEQNPPLIEPYWTLTY